MKVLKFSIAFVCLHFFIFNVMAQSEDTVWVRVTYYDYKSDGSNANFNCGLTGAGIFEDMVRNNLSKDSKPLLNKVYPTVLNDRVEEWFRPSEAGNEAVFSRDDNIWTGLKPYNSKTDEWVSQNFDPTSDMANIIIYDSLPLTRINAGENIFGYTNENFFPLSFRGFGNEEAQFPDRNYGFTMEIHTYFRYLPQKNQFFQFYGDDDVWVFINGKLALDLGGIHLAVNGQIDLDKNTADNLGLVPGKVYPLDFFFAERNEIYSYMQFQTNLITVDKELAIDVTPGDTIKAGETAKCAAYFLSDTGIVSLTELSGKAEWEFEDLNANNPKSILKPRYDTAWVTPVQAYTTLKVTVHYTENIKNYKASTNIVVIPNDPDHIVIEASPEKPGDKFLWEDNPLDSTLMGITIKSVDNFYGILRDKFGNWIGPANPVKWSTGDKELLTAEAGSRPESGQGKAIRRKTLSDTATVTIAEYDYSGKILRDDIVVKILYLASVFTEVEYYETDSRPDGLIDVIRIRTDGKIKISKDYFEDFYKLIRLPEHRKFIYDKHSFHITEDGFEIRVKQSDGVEPFTGTDERDILKFKEIEYSGVGIFPGQKFVIKDKLGPVINKAIFAGKRLDSDPKKNIPDTLEVFYSEKVYIPRSEIPFQFCYKGDNSKQYTMTLDLDLIGGEDKSNVMKFLVVSKTRKYPEQGDSIWIRSEKKVIDIIDVAQDSATIGRPLIVRYPLHIDVHTIGPYRLGDPVPPELADNSGRKGPVILFELKGLFLKNDNWKTTCNIYDPVGNTVKKDLAAYYKEVKNDRGDVKRFFVFVWDLKNMNRRDVYPGSYLGIVSISRNGLVIKKENVYITIKHNNL